MSLELSITSFAATSAVIGMTGTAGVKQQLQASFSPDFAFCACPIFDSLSGATATIDGLNQNSPYYIRGRNVLSGGVEEEWGQTIALHTPSALPWDKEEDQIRVAAAIIVKPVPLLGISSPAAFASFPAYNLTYPGPPPMRAAGPSVAITARVGYAPIDTIALLASNISEAATVVVTASNNPDMSSPGYTSPALPFRASPNVPGRPSYHGLYRLPVILNYNYIRVVVTGAVPGGVWEIGHLVMGLNQGTKAHAVDRKESPVPLGGLTRTRSGMRDDTPGATLRRHEFDIAMLSENDFEQHYGWLRYEQNKSMLMVPNGKAGPYIHDRIAYGDLVNTPFTQVNSTRFTRSFIIESII